MEMVLLTYLLQEVASKSWVPSIQAVAIILAAVVVGGTVVYRAIKKVRQDARTAKSVEIIEKQKLVDYAVAKVKAEMQALIDMAKEQASHWQQMYDVVKTEKEHQAEKFAAEKEKAEIEIIRVREERSHVATELASKNLKIEELIDLTLKLSKTEEMKRQTETIRDGKR